MVSSIGSVKESEEAVEEEKEDYVRETSNQTTKPSRTEEENEDCVLETRASNNKHFIVLPLPSVRTRA